jgi:hypothetical protein
VGKSKLDFKYSSNQVPDDYTCSSCGRRDVKLWRLAHTFDPELLCCICAADNQKKDIFDMDASGTISLGKRGRTDQIGWYVPAVPTEDGGGYWGYTSVPDAGCNWWRLLASGYCKIKDNA